MAPQENILADFGKRLREERLRVGQSQEELAHSAGLDRTYISDIERGVRNIGLRNIGELASALNLKPADLLAPSPLEISSDIEYTYAPDFHIKCGFDVNSLNVVAAVVTTRTILRALPITLFTTIDLKTQSGIVGAIFAAELATQVGAIPNPIEKGHPDIVPVSAVDATEAELRNYPEGLEIKCTLGNVAKGSGLSAGHARIGALAGLTWQAHHRDVRALMSLVWDFVGGSAASLAHPCVTGVFYSDDLQESDWGAISGTTGRNTKVTGMTASGRLKMGDGVIAVIDDPHYQRRYARSLGSAALMSLPGHAPERKGS